MTKATFAINDRWRLTEDGDVQWILQRENPKAKDDRHRWSSVAFCGTRGGLLTVGLPHNGVSLSDAASRVLNSLPEHYEPGALERISVETLDRAA